MRRSTMRAAPDAAVVSAGSLVVGTAGVHSICGPVPHSLPDTITRLLTVLSAHDYRIQESDPASGFIRAEKSRSGSASQRLTGAAYFTEVSVTVVAADGATAVRLRAVPVKEEAGRRSSIALTLPGSERAELDAIAVACGVVIAHHAALGESR